MGALVFWLLTAWLVTVGLSSIVPQIFGERGAASAAPADCLGQLRALRQDLLERSAASVEHLGDRAAHEELRAWLTQFDHALAHAKPACHGARRTAWQELLRLRHQLGAWLERLQHEQGARMRSLDAMLSSDLPRSPRPRDDHHERNH